ncbi:MAG: hypothetical protein IKE04_02810 [Oscillospiraceae bacterium]|nr:hypothetical protein [Oscillospiraceae bacterium]
MRRQTSAGEILQAPAESLRLFGESLAAGIRTALPGIIRSYDKTTQTAVIQPAVMETLDGTAQPLPLLQDVPVFFMGGASHAVTGKVSPGDECLVVFADTAIDAWQRSGGVQPAVTPRRHSLSDGFALVGFRSRPNALPPEAFPESTLPGAAEEAWAVKTLVDGEWKTPLSVDDDGKVRIDGYYAVTPENVDDLIDAKLEGALADAAPAVVKIDSSRGTAFKSNQMQTELRASVYWNGRRIEDLTTLREIFGAGAYLQWEWRRAETDTWSTLLVTDTHISDGGFTFTVTPQDVDDCITFRCSLIA